MGESVALLVLLPLLPLVLLLVLDYLLHHGWLRRRDSLAGQLVLITGAAGGLGRQLALSFARQGAVLALWDVRREALSELCEWLAAQGVAASALHPRCVDVADADAVEHEAAAQLEALGPVCVVVNNAAVVFGQPLLGSGGAPTARLQRSLDVNVAAQFWTARAFVPQMLTRERGTLVTVGSLMGSLPAAGLAEYCASKAAVGQLHACLRWELRRAPRVRCLLVRPYLIDTPLFAGGAPLRWRWLRPLLPPLDAARVARRVVEAVRCGQQDLVLPWRLKWLPPLLELLPPLLRDAALDVAGAEGAMDAFRGRGGEQWRAMGASRSE